MKKTISLAFVFIGLLALFGIFMIAGAQTPRCEEDEHQWSWSINDDKLLCFKCDTCAATYSVKLGKDEELPACKGGSKHEFYSTVMGNCENKEIEFECKYENCRECVIIRLPQSEQSHCNYAIESVREPDCLSPGVIIYRCQNPGCHSAFVEYFGNALGHDVATPDYTKLYKKADCTHNEIYYRCCKRCGKIYKASTYKPNVKTYIYDEKPETALGHSDLRKETTETALRTPRTATAPATYYYTCGRCGKPVTDGDFFCGNSENITMAEFVRGDIVQLGSYPQSLVKDESLLAAFASVNPKMKNYGYRQFNTNNESADITYGDFEFMGKRYRKVVIGEDRPANLLTNDTKEFGESKTGTYYFLWEPLNWKVISTPAGFKKLICCNIIDFQSYFTSKDFERFLSDNPWFEEDYGADIHDGIFTGNISKFMKDFIPDYHNSNLKNWLENDFASAAFTEQEQQSLYSCMVNDSYNKIEVLQRVTQIWDVTKKVLLETHKYGTIHFLEYEIDNNIKSYRAPVSDYALALRPDYTGNPVNNDNGIYYADGVAYAESAIICDSLGNTCKDKDNDGFGGTYYERTNPSLLFAPYYGTRPTINLADDYVPEHYSIQGVSTIENVESSAFKVYDVNGDDIIDIADLSVVISNLGQTAEAGVNDACDVNYDTFINVSDMSELLLEDRYGKKV